jgi:MSHA biogenesis protein MshM
LSISDCVEAPFRITPHTEFFFAGANRGATLEALIYAITHDEGIVKVSGEVGSGKTMLCRMLLEKLPEKRRNGLPGQPAAVAQRDTPWPLPTSCRLPLPDERSHLLTARLAGTLAGHLRHPAARSSR